MMLILGLTWLLAASSGAQEPVRMVPVAGAVVDADGAPRAGLVAVTFALYDNPVDGAPLWQETQTVEVNALGRYNVGLGATTGGLSADLFSSGAAHWLGVRVEGNPESPRTELRAVPYAVAAAESATLAGKPASDYVLADSLRATVRDEVETQAPGDDSPVTNAVVDRIPKFTSVGGVLDDSAIADVGGRIGIQNTSCWNLSRPRSRLSNVRSMRS